ncbi:MAG: hypothetical protein ACLGQX_01795, partial [Acidobacteriota bacterium]
MRKLFTERAAQPEPRVKETLGDTVQNALIQLVEQRIEDCSFGLSFPAQCPDGNVNAGVNEERLKAVMEGYRVIWPRRPFGASQPTDHQVFDLLEFTYEHVAFPSSTGLHSYFQHHHYRYDRDAGRQQFAADVNRLFERNGI